MSDEIEVITNMAERYTKPWKHPQHKCERMPEADSEEEEESIYRDGGRWWWLRRLSADVQVHDAINRCPYCAVRLEVVEMASGFVPANTAARDMMARREEQL